MDKGKPSMTIGAAEFFSSQIEEAKAKSGTPNFLVGSEAERAVIGLPLKALSLQYLYSSSAYPLGRMEMIIGESDTCKTALLFEKGRWFLREPGGGFIYLLNEARDPASLRSAIIPRELLEGGGFRLEGPCSSMEDWQRRVSHKEYGWLRRFEIKFKERGGCAFPFLIGLDSITGTTNEKAIESIDEEGCASITFGQDANILNQYAKYLFQRLYHWPGSFICTNHIKYGTDRYGNKVMRIPGGDELRYVSTYILLLKKVKDLDRVHSGGRRINIYAMKSMGEHREISVDFVWYYEPDGSQAAVWDWHSASIELLMSFTGEKKKAIEEIITFPQVVRQSKSCSCPELGIKKPAPYDEVGKAIMENEEILRRLQNLFGIQRRRIFQPGIPYNVQILEAIKSGDVEPVRAEAGDKK